MPICRRLLLGEGCAAGSSGTVKVDCRSDLTQNGWHRAATCHLSHEGQRCQASSDQRENKGSGGGPLVPGALELAHWAVNPVDGCLQPREPAATAGRFDPNGGRPHLVAATGGFAPQLSTMAGLAVEFRIEARPEDAMAVVGGVATTSDRIGQPFTKLVVFWAAP
uniref:Uncharacterized protein n=1 Tax=Plectus sambesii TaxID=2011161 RepID=A0A914WJV3_9BILA